ncbi:hypothetical protein OTU49_000830 [Cherax quadricarinatus]|uniref:VWFD domain-containing protein n=2 Tax=Cherax quadricarinatus TaxID=27406 RepID=A0AAW0XX11_CHEQU
MPVFENIGENTEVRIAAFIALSYMEPSIGWWTRVAVSTWHEPSSQVANYVSATITARAHGTSPVSKNAARVVHLIKPPVTLSLSHSASIFFQDILSNCEVDAVLSIGWLTSAKGLFPSKVFLRLTMKAFFGFSEETKAQIGQGEINALIRRLYGLLQIESHKDARGTEGEIVQEMFGEILEQLGFAHTATKSDLMIYLKLMDTVVALPILKDYTQVIQAAVTSVKDSFPHTGRETDFSLVVPTDLGLPFIIEYTSDYSYWIDGTSTGTQLRPAKTKSTFTFIFEVSVDKTLLTKTLLPWSNKFAVGAGVHNAHAVILPLKGYFVLDTQKHEIKLSIEAQHSSKVLLKNSHNFPYTVVTGPFPTALHPQQSDYKKIRITKEETFQRHTQALPDIYGISVESSWSGDFEFPLNLHSLSQDLDPFTPSYKSWDYRLEWDPQASTTKSITITLTYVTSESSGESEELVQVGQETQGAADFGDFSQVSNGGEQEFQEGSRDFQEIGDLELETFGQQQQQTNYRQRIEKLQEEVMPISGGYVKSISIGLDLQGSTSRSYETVLTWAVGSSAGQHSTKIHFTIISNPPEGTFEDPHAICFDVLVLKPKFTPLTTVEDLLTSNLQTIIEAQIYDGVSCKGSPVLEGQGYLDASEAVINHLKEELAKECDPDTSHLRLIDIITSSLYDHANFKAQWTEDYPLVLRNLSNHLNDYFEGILFPLVSYDHTATNPEHAREIDATKTLDTNHWTIRDVRPHLVAVTHDLKLPALIEEFLGPAQMYKTFIYNYIQGRTPSKCNIETTKVRTYDGVSFPYQADSCWVTAVLSHSGAEETQSYDYVISVRFTEEWEVRVLWPWAGFNYDITKSVLLVNGEELKKGDKFVNFIQQETGSLVIFKRLGFLIVISDKLTIGKPNELIGNINGLCGRLDGEKRHDLVGPTGCIFTNPSLFALSWTTQGEGCSLFSLRSKKRGVTQYQEACPREDYIPTAVSHPNVVYDCTQWEYKERTVGNLICDAIEPTPSCKPNCKKTMDISKDLNYDCKKLVSTQTEAYCQQSQGRNLTRECHPHTLLTTYPASCVPQ